MLVLVFAQVQVKLSKLLENSFLNSKEDTTNGVRSFLVFLEYSKDITPVLTVFPTPSLLNNFGMPSSFFSENDDDNHSHFLVKKISPLGISLSIYTHLLQSP